MILFFKRAKKIMGDPEKVESLSQEFMVLLRWWFNSWVSSFCFEVSLKVFIRAPRECR